MRLVLVVWCVILCASLVHAQAPGLADMPPDIRALVMKGSKMTDEERTKVAAWMRDHALAGMPKPGAGAGSASAVTGASARTGGGGMMTSIDGMVPVENRQRHLDKLKSPTQAEYVAAVGKAQKALHDGLGPNERATLDGYMAKHTNPVAWASAGVMITPKDPGEGSYLLATAALKLPKDATLAADLGAALYALGELKAALGCYLYVEALKPNTPVGLAGRAYVTMYLGDLATAQALFEKAVALDPGVANGYEGLALIAEARGDKGKAREMFVKALGQRFTMVAMMGVRAGKTGGDDSQPPPEISDDGVDRPGDDAPADDGGGGGPYENGTGFANNWPQRIKLPDLPADPVKMGALAGELAQWVQQNQQRYQALVAQTKTALDDVNAHPPNNGPKAMDDGTVIYPRIYARQLSLLSLARKRFDAITRPHFKKLGDEFTKWRIANETELPDIVKRVAKEFAGCNTEACRKAEHKKLCELRTTLAKQSNAAMGQVWTDHMKPIRDAAWAYYDETKPIMRELVEQRYNRWQNADRRLAIENAMHEQCGMYLSQWASFEAGIATGEDCNPPKPKELDEEDKKPDKEGKDAKCPAKNTAAKVGATFDAGLVDASIGIKMDCDKVEFTLEIGLLKIFSASGGIEHKFGEHGQPGTDTIGMGVGLGGKVMGQGGGLKGQGYITFQGETPVDFGAKASAEASVSKGVVSNESKTEVTLSLMPGSTPLTHTETTNTTVVGPTFEIPGL